MSPDLCGFFWTASLGFGGGLTFCLAIHLGLLLKDARHADEQ